MAWGLSMPEGLLAEELGAALRAHSIREDEQLVEEFGMLGLDGAKLMFMLARPRTGLRRTGVVLCHSVFEFKMLQSAEIALARAAASKGFPSIYFHAPGVGDSEGSPQDCTIDVRVSAALAAAAELRRRVPEIETVCLFGTRIGGAVAVLAAQRAIPEAGVVLWDPAFKADDYWKQTKRFTRVVATLDRQKNYVDLDERIDRDGSASFLGYTVSRDLVDDLAAIDDLLAGPKLRGPALVVSLNEQMVAKAVKELGRVVAEVDGVSLGRPKPRDLIHMGIHEAAEAVDATVSWMERKLP